MRAPTSPGTGLEIRPARSGDDPARDALVRALPAGTLFHLRGWSRVIERVFGHEVCDLVALEQGRLVGVLPLMRCRSFSGRRVLLSMPYAVYGGPLSERVEVERELALAAVRQAQAERSGRLELRCREDHGLDLVAHELYATFAGDLPADPAEVLARMPKKARAEARRARERHGLRLSEGIWYLDDLVRLFHANKRALGSPGLPRSLFRELRGELGEAVRVHLVHQGARPVSAVMSFVWRDELLAYYAGSAPGADRELSASNFMYMALQEWAVEHGLRRFDFGRSRKDSGAFEFKLHQGFQPRDLPYRLHLVGERTPPSFTPSNPRTRWLRSTWSRLPAWLTVRLSGPLARYLP